ncbi:fasciclin-like arabinogalactan protein 19 [Dendrobium catenatum]|uniref:Fasciclin-like arabinogalactan protein 19 n=1 Tax=Dendrobium catenatum TaxID=906689 RepID=A0A2I0X9V0_9ASPA|nr:fasciclin-like arabinogalactan protein 19 [Dendrobium catenatum]PKU84699.1 Fasciclin-like arabinogalactan protein 19 [Dendrobium catenatum]
MEKAKPLAVLLLLVPSLMLLFSSSMEISEEELEDAIYSLRSRGYRLFGNAITSSDVCFDLLFSNASFTLFAPTDASLFSIDMVFSASAYFDVLRHHVALGRHSLPVLRSLIPGTAISTLLPSGEIVISHRDSLDVITIDGVDVSLPGLFYSQNLAVHGLAGTLSQRTAHESETTSPVLRSHDSRPGFANSKKRSSAMHFALMGRHSPAPKRAVETRGIFISPVMLPIADEISDSLQTAAPAAFSWGYGTCRESEDLCSPSKDTTGNQRSHLPFGEDETNL